MIQHAPGLLLLLALGAIIYFITIVLATGWRLRHPPRRTYASAVARGMPADPGELSPPLKYETWNLNARGLTLPVWDITGSDPAGPVVVLTHGWGDSKIGAIPRTPYLAPFASRLIAFDMRGHGEATGVSTLGLREPDDLCTLLDQLGNTPTVLYGWSLGAVVTLAAAASGSLARPPIAVIAEAPYRFPETPARNVLRSASLPSGLSLTAALWTLGLTGQGRTRFDVAAHASRLPCPLLVMHGEDDTISPFSDGSFIAQATPNAQIAPIKLGDHNRLWTDPGMLEQSREVTHAFLSHLAHYHPSDVRPAPQPDR